MSTVIVATKQSALCTRALGMLLRQELAPLVVKTHEHWHFLPPRDPREWGISKQGQAFRGAGTVCVGSRGSPASMPVTLRAACRTESLHDRTAWEFKLWHRSPEGLRESGWYQYQLQEDQLLPFIGGLTRPPGEILEWLAEPSSHE